MLGYKNTKIDDLISIVNAYCEELLLKLAPKSDLFTLFENDCDSA